jgi:hypothetical protein
MRNVLFIFFTKCRYGGEITEVKMCGTCVTDEEIRKANKIMAQNVKKGHLKWENTIKVDFIEIFRKGVHGLTVPRVGAVVKVLKCCHEWKNLMFQQLCS